MEIKDLIKIKREELGLTYESLGEMVGVGKSTVRKWETGMIENMRRDNIVALSKALNISPSILMGWEEIDTNKKENKKTETSVSIKEHKLLKNFNELNENGKDEAIKRVSELSLIPSYKKDSEFKIDTIAAHNDHLDEEGEIENIMKDLEDMDNW